MRLRTTARKASEVVHHRELCVGAGSGGLMTIMVVVIISIVIAMAMYTYPPL